MRKALIVGINNYPNIPLSGCINDANAVGATIQTHGNGDPNFEVIYELDAPRKGPLKKQIMNLFSGEADSALFYFSGHGFFGPTGGVLVTPDYSEADEGISLDEILTIVNESKIKDKIVILDCCHSGAFGEPKNLGGTNTHIANGVTILTASGKDEVALETKGGHGVFTELLLEALRGGAADLLGMITPGSVYAFIDQSLGAWGQRPMFKTNISRFTTLRQINPQVPTTTLRKIVDYFDSPTDIHGLDPEYEPDSENPDPTKTQIFADLQAFEGVGLLIPIDEEHMYYAAMNSRGCKLTAKGAHYWRLAKNGKL